MAEDDEEQECCFGKLRSGDEDLFGSLLHLADHCLYRIVRWARNLPDFANVSVSILNDIHATIPETKPIQLSSVTLQVGYNYIEYRSIVSWHILWHHCS